MAKSKSSLAKLYSTIFPKLPQEKTLAELAETFHLDGDDPLEVPRRAARRSGAALAFQLLLGHGEKADLDKVTKSLPEVDGKPKDLGEFQKAARKYARQVIDLVERTQKEEGPEASAQTAAP